MKRKLSVISRVTLEKRILTIRNERVILDADLAEVYGVTTKALNQAVKRNVDRFPNDFAFFLTDSDKSEGVTNFDHRDRLRFSPDLPPAFTQLSAIMAAPTLNRARAVQIR